MNIYPSYFHNASGVVLEGKKISTFDCTTFPEDLNLFICFEHTFVPESTCLLSNSNMDQVKEVKAVWCAVLKTKCLFAMLDLYWSQNRERW